ncbi:hypothetical protein A3731_19600 [Roseovarius sp. HI0049]|nr:hypothetical protein A3731_19600 [Roseovarius sp. HI0049]
MRSLILAALPALSLSFALPAQSQEAAPPPLSIKSSEITRLDTLRNYSADDSLVCCAVEVLESGPDHDFVYMHILLDVEWTEDIKRISYYGGNDIKLKLPGQSDPETFLKPWGSMDWFPEVRTSPASISESRDRKWPDVDNDTYLEAVFTVPSDVTEGTLVIGKKDEPKLELAVDLSGEVTEFPQAGSLWDIEITGLSLVDEVVTNHGSRDQSVPGRVRPLIGKLVKVDMTLTPQRDLKADRLNSNNAAAFTSKHVWLVGPEGLPMALVGEERENGGNLTLSSSNSSTTNWQGEGTTGQIERSYYFLGSGAPGEYQLYFKDVNVDSATLE